MTSSIRTALVSHPVVPGGLDANLQAMDAVLQTHAGEGIQLFLFPELCLSGFPPAGMSIASVAEPVPGGPAVARVATLARQYATTICAGLLEVDDDAYYVTHVLCGPDGYLGKQRKLFTAQGQKDSGVLSSGCDLQVFTLDGHPCVILTCADWIYPEAVLLASTLDVEVILAPTDRFAASQQTLLHVFAAARVLDSEAALLVAFGGDPGNWEMEMAALAMTPDGAPETWLCQATRRHDARTVTVIEVPLHPPRRRHGHPRDRQRVFAAHFCVPE
jgi:predicted amidohydrolase